ncbi:hypothetical protein BDY24DRAFT_394057 [Mrakia frigida]|uniref:uncharacterized protein n=1 Tax=Mrakia frigida TaxID=29902 RepID=UPI003FCBFCE3
MVFSPPTLGFVNALASASRRASTPRPRHSLLARSISQQPPSSSSSPNSSPKSNPPPSSSPLPKPLPSTSTSFKPRTSTQLELDVKFSSITSSEDLAALLQAGKGVKVDLLSESERRRHETIVRVLDRASEMDNEDRIAYFKRVDLYHSPRTEVELRRREKARRQVERGVWLEDDNLTMEEWDEKWRVKREGFMAQMGAEYKSAEVSRVDRAWRAAREGTLLRRKARREMQEEEEKKKAEGEGGSSTP